jgi:hypothetical protein
MILKNSSFNTLIISYLSNPILLLKGIQYNFYINL